MSDKKSALAAFVSYGYTMTILRTIKVKADSSGKRPYWTKPDGSFYHYAVRCECEKLIHCAKCTRLSPHRMKDGKCVVCHPQPGEPKL